MTGAHQLTNKALVAGVLAVFTVGCGSSLARHPGGTGGAGAGTGGGRFVGTGGGAGLSGRGGAAGSVVGGAGGGSVAADCGPHDSFGPLLRAFTVGPSGDTVYEGWAIVERSTATELVLAFQPDGMTLPMHAKLSGPFPMPRLPVAATVWLFKSPSGEPVLPGPPYGVTPWSVIVRDRQSGRLLFGAAWKPTVLAPSPVPLGAVTAVCTTADPEFCNLAGTVVYSSVDVQGDAVVTIPDSQTRTVAIGGVDYDVWVSAQQEVQQAGATACADFFVDGGVAVYVHALDLASLTPGLGAAIAPACSEGNDDGPNISVYLSDADVGTYDGPIFYRGRSVRAPACLAFDPVGLTSSTGSPPTVEVCAPETLLPEPSLGQEFWLSSWSYWASALFGPQRGSLLLAAVSVSAPYDADAAANVERVLGIHVDAVQGCAYANPDASVSSDVTSLYDVVFATTPPTRVASESITTVRIANEDHRVWTSAEGRGVWYVIH